MKETETIKNGIQIDLLNGSRLENVGSEEKIRMILDSAGEGNVVILDDGLTSEEEGKLIERTMAKINPSNDFNGLEIETYERDKSSGGGLIGKVLNNKEESNLTIIGPANKLETLHKDEKLLSTLVSQ